MTIFSIKRLFCGLIAAFFVAIASVLPANGRSVKDFFLAIPDSIVPLLPSNVRLDMVDYFAFGSDHKSANAVAGEAYVKGLSDNVIEFSPDKDVDIQLAMLTSESDTLLAVVTTLHSPVADSSIDFYTTSWHPADKVPVSLPSYSRWLTPDADDSEPELRLLMPFMPVSASFNPEASVLTITNEAPHYLSHDDYESVKSKLIGSFTFDIDAITFTQRP